jgi:hypothetical protein
VPWAKGQSGNPGGRRKGEKALIGNFAIELRRHSPVAVKALLDAAKQRENLPVAVAAANSLLDRMFGRPAQTVDLDVKADVHQLSLFGSLGIDDVPILEAELIKAIEHDRERERNLQPVSPPAEGEPELQPVSAGERQHVDEGSGA